MENEAPAGTAGTFVAGLAVNTASTATTADVRGTLDPNSACNGARRFKLIMDPPRDSYLFLGNSQYAG